MHVSRRNSYIVGAAAAVAGLVMIVAAVLVVSGDDEPADSGPVTSSPTEPPRPAMQPPRADRGSVADRVSRRERVRAPGFSLAVIREGQPPVGAPASLERASRAGELALADLTGTPVVLQVWSSDCPPCRADARLAKATSERWGRRGVAFVGLFVDRRERDALRFARQYGLAFPVVHDQAARAANGYGVERLPETFFISGAGDVVGHVAGRASVRQMELGAGAARSARRIGSEQGAGSVPLR